MVCLGFELGPQDGWRRRNHGAMAATRKEYCLRRFEDLFPCEVTSHHPV